MPLQDRTNEFLSCVESIRGRSSLPTKVPSRQRRDNKSDFTRMASVIGKDISTTTVKLGKLAQREHVYTLFFQGALLNIHGSQWRSVKRCLMTGPWR